MPRIRAWQWRLAKEIPYAEGYSCVVLEIEANSDQRVYSLERSLRGGDVLCKSDGLPDQVLAAKHLGDNNESGHFAPDVIERQLAHAERNKVRAAYHRAEYLAERRRMMQVWADLLDGLRTGAEVVPLLKTA